MARCNDCGLPENRKNLCDRWDCPDLKPSICCQILGPPVALDLVQIRLDDKPVMISRRLADKIQAVLKETRI